MVAIGSPFKKKGYPSGLSTIFAFKSFYEISLEFYVQKITFPPTPKRENTCKNVDEIPPIKDIKKATGKGILDLEIGKISNLKEDGGSRDYYN